MTLAQGRVVRKSALAALLGGGRLSMRICIALASLSQVVVAAFALLHLLVTTTAMSEWLPYATVAGGILNIALYAYLDRGVVQPMAAATDLGKSLAGGDLTQRALPQRDGEGGRLLRALSQLQVNLLAAIGDIRENVTAINQATREIAAGNAILSARTETGGKPGRNGIEHGAICCDSKPKRQQCAASKPVVRRSLCRRPTWRCCRC